VRIEHYNSQATNSLKQQTTLEPVVQKSNSIEIKIEQMIIPNFQPFGCLM